MPANEIRVGDIGTAFIATIVNQDGVVIDLSGASILEMIFKKSNGTKVTKTPIFNTDGTDGKIVYTTSSANDLDIPGMWSLQARVVIGSGEWRSDIHTFKVYGNI